MREIKFRAYYLDEAEKDVHSKPYAEWGVDWLNCDLEYVMKCDDYAVVQYTGIKDKNGAEIYEDDILGGIYEPLQVKWCYNQGGYELHYMNECYACNGDIFWHEVAQDNSDVEVIGNIYENPELLNV